MAKKKVPSLEGPDEEPNSLWVQGQLYGSDDPGIHPRDIVEVNLECDSDASVIFFYD